MPPPIVPMPLQEDGDPLFMPNVIAAVITRRRVLATRAHRRLLICESSRVPLAGSTRTLGRDYFFAQQSLAICRCAAARSRFSLAAALYCVTSLLQWADIAAALAPLVPAAAVP